MMLRTLILKVARENPSFHHLVIKISQDMKDKEDFRRFWKEVYEGGKKKVKNPNPKGRKDEVTANTAMKDKSFQNHVYKEYKQWKSENEENKQLPKVKLVGITDMALEQVKEEPNFKEFFKDKDPLTACLKLCGVSNLGDKKLSVSVTLGAKFVNVGIVSEDFEMTRNFEFNNGKPVSVYNNHFSVKEQGKGLGTKIFSSQVQEAKISGFKNIITDAAAPIDEHTEGLVGYYVWPLLGYNAKINKDYFEKESVERMKKSLNLDEDIEISTIRDVFEMPEGIEWWKKYGWTLDEAKFDLSSDSESLKILNAYLEKKGMEKIAKKKKKEKLKKGWSDAPILDEDIINKVWEELQVK